MYKHTKTIPAYNGFISKHKAYLWQLDIESTFKLDGVHPRIIEVSETKIAVS